MSSDDHITDLEQEARERFRTHVIERAQAARLRYGLSIDAVVIREMLDDRDVVRYPTALHFDAAPLQAGEFAYAQPVGFHPSDGLALFVHPHFQHQPENLPLLIAYHIPTINFGEIAGRQEAELFGATLLGLDVDAYYAALCELADSIPQQPAGGDPVTTEDGGWMAVATDGAVHCSMPSTGRPNRDSCAIGEPSPPRSSRFWIDRGIGAVNPGIESPDTVYSGLILLHSSSEPGRVRS